MTYMFVYNVIIINVWMGMCIIIPNVIYKIGELNNEESGRTF